MTTDKLFTTWADEELRCRVKNYARGMTRSNRRYHQLVCKAWEAIGEALPDKTDDYYFWVAKWQMHRLRDVYCYSSMPVVGANRHPGYVEAISTYDV
jgi:hypothetical protein